MSKPQPKPKHTPSIVPALLRLEDTAAYLGLLSMSELAESFNGKYVQDHLQEFILQQQYKIAIIKSAETLDAGYPANKLGCTRSRTYFPVLGL